MVTSLPTRTALFVFALAACIALAAWPAPASAAPAGTPQPPGGEAVRPALKQEAYPWYDAADGRVVPVLSRPDWKGGWWKSFTDWLSDLFAPLRNWLRGLNRWSVPGVAGVGDLLAIGLTLLILTFVIVGLLELLRRYRPPAIDPANSVVTRTGRANRIEGLPAGVRLNSGDPWSEAQRLRDEGDLAGAVVFLFAHQILALERLRQVRLVPGRTGRQLVRSVTDRDLRTLVDPTLRLFELVYYGGRVPSRDEFEEVWSYTPRFEQRVAETSRATVAGVMS
ncbi:MAG: DUF4129 domain-containing protein [Isosphaeraceae bacterium]